MKYLYRKVAPNYKRVVSRKWWHFPGIYKVQHILLGYKRNPMNSIDDNFEFTDEAALDLENYFKQKPPRVGDVIYIECPYMIVKTFFNLNHNRTEVWLAPKIGWAEEDAPNVS